MYLYPPKVVPLRTNEAIKKVESTDRPTGDRIRNAISD